jgi:3-hydroxyacyl-CoA dehydrogenase/enoyl-CoA hydratase/carnithine racemase
MADEVVTEFKLTYYDSPRAGRLALMTMDNGADYKRPSTFGAGALRSLSAAMDELEGQAVKGLMLTGKPFIFAVGADLNMFEDADAEFAREGGKQGHAVFRRLANLPFPTLAAINGACMGGGMEIALHCDYRTLSDAAAALAFPEVFLSIFPAWGGTQLAPRIVGAEHALTTIVHNSMSNNTTMKPKQAYEMGFADWLLPAVDFYDDSVALLERLVAGEEEIQRPAPSTDGLDEALANARAFADNTVHGATAAPYRAIDLIEHAARGGDLDEGYRQEEEGLAELLPARQAQAAIYAFDLTQQRVKAQPWRPDVEGRDVKKIGVVGSGLMGAQLGTLFLRRFEMPLVMKDIDQGVLDDARSHIEGELDKQAGKGRMDAGKAEFLKSIVTYTLDYEPLSGADFIIEAVLEELGLKQKIWADVENVVDDGCVLASNTSSLSITDMAAELAHPERVIGFHFFNPVAVLPFLEIVRAQKTSDAAIATGFDVSKTLRKSGVLCADTPAFIVNRLLTRFMGASMAAANQGNSFAEIDDAIKELGLPMGPFELLGFVGIQVAYHTTETLHGHYPDRFPLDANFGRLAELDVDGVYDWSKGREPHEAITKVWQLADGASPLPADRIRQDALEAVAEEAKIMLDEGVVADARDIDTGLLLGAGWPFFMGGACKYLDQTGMSERLFGRQLVGAVDQAG